MAVNNRIAIKSKEVEKQNEKKVRIREKKKSRLVRTR